MHAGVERRVPRLALVPRDQLQARSLTKATGQQQQRQAKQSVKRDAAHNIAGEQGIVKRQHELTDEDTVKRGENDDELVEESSVECCKGDAGSSEEQQLWLGERFLHMMAAMARLPCMPLDSPEDGGGDAEKQPLASSHTPKHQSDRAASPTPDIRDLDAAATADRHATELSAVADPQEAAAAATTQKAQTTTALEALVPDITRHEHSRHDNRSPKPMEKFVQLKRAAEPPSSSQMVKSSSMPMLGDRRYLYAFPSLNRSASVVKSNQRSSDENDENGCDEEESDSDSGKSEGESEDGQEEQEKQDQDQDARSENNEPTFSSFFTHFDSSTAGIGEVATSHTYPRNEAAPLTFSDTATPCDDNTSAASSFSPSAAAVATTTPARKHPLFHQPAWISPEPKNWLVSSGMFQTKPRYALIR